MKPLERIDRETFQLIITRRDATEILLLQDGSDWSLPSVEILPKQRIAPQLAAEVRAKWELDTYCLFLLFSNTVDRNAKEPNFALLEFVRRDDQTPPGACWMSLIDAVGEGGRVTGERAAIRDALGQLESYAKEPGTGPFARPGWLKELIEWTEVQVHPCGLRMTGNVLQLNASPAFSLMRLETSGPAVWFKATGEPNRHELAISVSLAHLFPGHVPPVWGIHSSWNGWLAPEAPGRELGASADLSTWEGVAYELAELEIASIGKHDELLGARCKDLRLRRLADEIDPFLGQMGELMAVQEHEPPRALRGSDLALVRDSLNEAISVLEDVGMPDTLGHMDFNPGNIFISRERCVFLDWADGAVTNPLVTFEYLVEHFRRRRPNDRADVGRVRAAYLRPWQAFFPRADLERATGFSPLIAVFAYAVQANAWGSPEGPNPRRAGFLRSLARRMFREANDLIAREH